MPGFTIPDRLESPAIDWNIQSGWYQTEIEAIVAGHRNHGVISGCAVTAGTGLAVNVALGTVMSEGSELAVSADTVSLSAAHAILKRYDLIVVDAAGDLQVRESTPSTAPYPVPLTTGDVLLASVYVPALLTQLLIGHLTDKRVLIVEAGGGGGGGPADTDELPEGSTNLYYTDARADARVSAGIATHVGLSDPHSQYLLESAFNLSTFSTSNLVEGSNKYYTDQRVTDVITGLGLTSDHGGLAGLGDDDHTQYLLLGGRAAVQQDVVKGLTVSTYMRVGSNTAPANTAAGDLTAGRLFLGDSAVANNAVFRSLIASHVPPISTTYYHTIDLTVAPDASSTSERDGVNLDYHVQPTANDGGLHIGMRSNVVHDSGAFNLSNAGNSMTAMVFRVVQAVGSSTVTMMRGVGGSTTISAGDVTTVRAFDSQHTGSGGGAVGTLVHYNIGINSLPTSLTLHQGINIPNLGGSGVTTAVGIDLAAQSGATNNFSIRNAGNMVQTGYMGLGAVTVPALTASGDLTTTGNTLHGGYLRVGSSSTAPTNTTAGDITAARLFVTNGVAAVNSTTVQLIAPSKTPSAPTYGLYSQAVYTPNGGNAVGRGLQSETFIRPTADDSAFFTGNVFLASHDSGAFNLTGGIIGFQGDARQATASTTVTALYAVYAVARVTAGTATSVRNIYSEIVGGGAAVTNWNHLEIAVTSYPTALTTHIGVKIPNLGNAAVTNAIGIDIAAQSAATALNIGIRNAAPTVLTPSTAQNITATSATILANASVVQLTANASYVLASTPTIADGSDGQILTIVNVDTVDVITLQDQGTLASSNLRLNSAVRRLNPRQSITLVYNATVGDWVECAGAAFSGARVYNSANISAPTSGTTVFLTFDSERYDTDSYHSTGSDTGRITVPIAGYYRFTAHVAFAANTVGDRAAFFQLNGSIIFGALRIRALAAGSAQMSFSADYLLAAGDYVEVGVNQTSGGALNITNNANYSPEFSVQYLG